MIQQMGQSEDNVLGYRVVGDVTKDDYIDLTPTVEAAIKEYGAIRLLFDLSDFKWEKVDAWSSDLGFGKGRPRATAPAPPAHRPGRAGPVRC